MKKLFDMNHPLMVALGIAGNLIVVNLLTLVLCIPLFTMGPALTAMNRIMIPIVNDEAASIVSSYFRAFKENLKKGFLMGLVLIGVMILLLCHYLAVVALIPVLRVVTYAMAIIALAVFFYAFALLARYENTVGNTLKNAVLLAVSNFPRTLFMVVFAVALWTVCIVFYRIGPPLLFMFGLSLPCYMNVLLLGDVFQRIEGETKPSELKTAEEGSVTDKAEEPKEE